MHVTDFKSVFMIGLNWLYSSENKLDDLFFIYLSVQMCLSDCFCHELPLYK